MKRIVLCVIRKQVGEGGKNYLLLAKYLDIWQLKLIQ